MPSRSSLVLIVMGVSDAGKSAVGKALADAGNLRGRLPLAENDFWHAIAKLPVVVEFGEVQVLVGEMAQALDSLINGEVAIGDGL